MLVGDASSAAHESILRDTVRRYFSKQVAASATFHLQPASTPPGWALVTDLALRSLAATQSATAEISAGTVRIRGVTENSTEWRAAAERIERSLIPGMSLEDQVTRISADTTFADACRLQLQELGANRRVEFAATSHRLRPSSLAMLDAIAELSVDCSDFTLRVTGHTDATGNEAENRALSQARAQAVVAYLVGRGVPRSRAVAEGLGSSEPVAEGASRRARRLNRRVEFDFVDVDSR